MIGKPNKYFILFLSIWNRPETAAQRLFGVHRDDSKVLAPVELSGRQKARRDDSKELRR